MGIVSSTSSSNVYVSISAVNHGHTREGGTSVHHNLFVDTSGESLRNRVFPAAQFKASCLLLLTVLHSTVSMSSCFDL